MANDLPYTYKVSRKLAGGRYKEYWRFRRDGIDTSLPGSPGNAAFHTRYSELLADAEKRATAPDKTPSRHTFAWLCQAYLGSADFNALSPRTQDDYHKTIEHRLLPALGDERFDAIQRRHIRLLRDTLAKDRSPRTAHKIPQTASVIYSWAEEADLLPANFTNPGRIKRIKGKPKAIEIWSPEEVALFLAHCDSVTKTACLLALYTGQRREDLVRMEWADVQGDFIRVRQNKTGEPLTIKCHAVLKKHLQAIRTPFGGPILRGANKRPMNANQLSAAMNRAVASVPGMPHRSLHGLRYAAAGALEAAGCSVVQISSIVGHRTYQMAMKYASQRRDAEAAIDRIERA